jgi:hypothetical protein
MRYGTTVAKSNRGYYHISIDRGNLTAKWRPICGARPPQRMRSGSPNDQATTAGEMLRKWENTIHPDLRCTACTSEARRQREAETEDGRVPERTTRRADVGPANQNRQETP